MAEKKEPRGLARFDPFAEFDLLSGWSPFRHWGMTPPSLRRLLSEPGRASSLESRLAPAVDISEDDERYVVTVELPGSKKDDITVEMHGSVLTIRGEKRNEREGRREHSRWIERCYGSFSRSFTLPADAIGERIEAEFREGILTVEIPKAEGSGRRRVSID
jgi:HSP20 family protein